MRPWRLLGWIGVIAVAGFCLTKVATVAISVVIGVFLTALLAPAARRLWRHGFNRALATTVVFVTALVMAAAFIALLVPPTVESVTEMRASVGKVLNDLHIFLAGFGINDRQLLSQATDWLSGQGRTITTGALAGVRTAGEIVVGAVLAVILSVYFVHSGDHLFRWLVSLAPAKARGRLMWGGELIFSVIGRYVRGIAIVGAVDGFFIGLALWILGVPMALPLAVLTFVGAFLPVVGAFLAGLLAAVVALVAKGWLVALIVVAVTIAVQQLEGHVLAPQIYGKALELPGAVILVAIALGSVVAGIVGAFLAAPVTSVVVALMHRHAEHTDEPPAPAPAERPPPSPPGPSPQAPPQGA
ncbi:pheromone autoinducer 2 transporter [Nonomuraea coxensis DSM 45129]|uniref:Pheromone autoinducer 2 transporter n=1 Tax=Nonomuraea coxensis DSM 45129 TaxID=1122611 RepID=A0ABX8TVB9_9ACTN|nr:AI-2E family transporter [Nonomuraea coxensis]QYC39420.1 pheromone autoinducer 2 transporter [Nonomuraea coxensis DSM 45129]